MDKENVEYACNKISFSLKKEEILTHAKTMMNLEDILLSETSHRKTNAA